MSSDRIIWCERGWQPVHYGFCPSEKAWKREMRRFGLEESYPTTDARTTTVVHRGVTCCLVTIDDDAEANYEPDLIIGLIVHEATHIWQEIQEVIGEDKPGREMEAYAMQAIVQELLTAYRKTRGKA